MVKKAKKKPEAKLLRKDVLKLIDNLTSGQYLKGTGMLVSVDLQHFCCLGVWADQHGCVFHTAGDPIPSLPGKNIPPGQGTGVLQSSLAFGLSLGMQERLASVNDASDTWKEVLHYLVDKVLPEAV